MIVSPLAVHSPRAVKEALLARGWNDVRADAAASGVGPFAVLVSGASPEALQALVHHGGKLGLDVLTGDDWALIAGSLARFGALARPWVVPTELAELAIQVGSALPPEPPTRWETARGSVGVDRPVIIGIINVTPDSFSDGGQFARLDAAIAQAERLLEDGADLLDIGGESTRPGRPQGVDAEEECRRILPLVEAVVRRHPAVLLSVDTVKSEVARAALGAGAAVINDVSGFRLDPVMARVAAETGAGAVLMHSRGGVSDMATYDHADYAGNVVSVVCAELRQALDRALQGGVSAERIVLDPGFGFAKTPEQTLELCDGLAQLLALGRPLLVGPSRKRFLGLLTGKEVMERDGATAAACVVAYERGARLFRVHNAALAREALVVAHGIRSGKDAASRP